MKPDATHFYYLKLRNLFLAHQETYGKIEQNHLDAATKSTLTKKLFLYEGQIRKLLTEKSAQTNKVKATTSGDHASTFFAFNKSKYVRSWLTTTGQLVPLPCKNGSTTQYFVKKRSNSIPTLEKELNSFLNINGSEAYQFIDCLEEKLSLEEQNSEDVKLDDVSKATSVVSSLEDETMGFSKLDDQSKVDVNKSAATSPIKRNDYNDDLSKADFFRKLGLIPRDEYDEVISRKNSRKRRTTANPQFSSAALEAKRQTKMEIIAERKNRRQLTLDKQNAFKSLRDEEHKIANGKMATLFSDNKAKNNFKIDNKQLFPGLYLVKRITNAKYYCKVCMDLCQCSMDTVIVCKRCSTFFHLTCIAPKKNISTLFELSCPGCSSISHSHQTGERKKLLKRLHELRKYILSLTHANQILQLLCMKRESEKSQLLSVIKHLQKQSQDIKYCLTATLDYEQQQCGNESLESAISSDSSSIGQADSSEVSNALSGSNQSQCDSVNGSGGDGHLMAAQRPLNQFDELVESSLYSSSEMFLQEGATKCDTDLPVLTFCV